MTVLCLNERLSDLVEKKRKKNFLTVPSEIFRLEVFHRRDGPNLKKVHCVKGHEMRTPVWFAVFSLE